MSRRSSPPSYNGGRGSITEDGLRERKAEIRPTEKHVDKFEQSVLQRQAEADQRYRDVIGAMVKPGDAAQESRNTRCANRIQRDLDAATTAGERVAVAQRLIEQADDAQLGVLVQELPSLFAGHDSSWIEAKLREVRPELADAATDRRKAAQTAQMTSWAAERVRHGLETGIPPVTVAKLAEAVAKYDPDADK